MNVISIRPDGTFVIEFNGMPYHVTEGDPLFAAVQHRAAELAQSGTPVTVEVEPPPLAAPVPASITFAQLLIGLVSEGWITEADGRAWRDRVALPEAVVGVIAQLPEASRFAAETRAFAPSEVLRADPLVAAIGVVAGKSSADLDQFFRTYRAV